MRRIFPLPFMVMLALGLASLFAPAARAQDWSEWATLPDGRENLLQYRTASSADETTNSGTLIQFEISSQYAYSVVFNVKFVHGEDPNSDLWKFHLSPNKIGRAHV